MRYAMRMLAKNPNFTLIAVLVLALGIGANTAIFGIVNTLMIEPLPYRNAGQIVVPATVFKKHNTDRGSNSYSDFLDWKAQTQLFDSVALFVQQPYDVTGGERPERLRGAVVTEDYFRIAGAVPIIGRTFVAEENQPKANRVVVLSYSLWMRRFGGDPKIAGTRIELAGVPRQVVGVMGKDAEWPDDIDLWVPLGFGTRPPEWALRRDNHIWQTVARLRSGVSLGQAQAQLDVMARRIEKDYPESRGGTGWKLHPLAQWIVGGELRQILFILLGAVGLVLAIACVNIANLLLARGATREREIAIRTALGARWPRLVRQMLTESLLLSAAGGALGLLLAWWGVRAVVHYAPEGTPRLNEIGLDPVVLAFTMFLSILTAVLFGLIPAMHAARIAPLESMREGGRSATSGIGRRRLRSLLGFPSWL